MARAKPPVVAPAGRQGGQEAASRQAAVTIPRALAYLTLVGLAVLFLWLTIRVDLVIFAGVLFGICLRRTAAALRRLTRLPIGWSLLVVFLLILGFFVGTGWFFLERISSQITELSVQLPAAAAKVGDMISQSALGKMLMHHLAVGNLQAFPTTALQSFFGAAINVAGVLGGIVVIMSVALYVAAEAERYAAGLVLLVPPARRPRAARSCTRRQARCGTGCWGGSLRCACSASSLRSAFGCSGCRCRRLLGFSPGRCSLFLISAASSPPFRLAS